MVSLPRPDLIAKLPGWGAVVAAALVGVAFAALPPAWLEAGVDSIGVAALVQVAQPPLGATARAVLALAGGGVAAALAWASLYLLVDEGGFLAPRKRLPGDAPQVRRADAHPDAPPRRPLTAAELGAPIGRAVASDAAIPTVGPVEREVPADLDTPLAALDPAAILPVPREPLRALAALAPGERLQTFALIPPVAKPTPPIEPPSIDALLRRLEQGTRRQAA